MGQFSFLFFLSFLLFLFATSAASTHHDTLEIFAPETESVCPKAYEMLQQCEVNFVKCENNKRTAPDCFQSFSICVSDHKVSIDPNCETFVKYILRKTAPGMYQAKEAISRLMEGCEYKDHEQIMDGTDLSWIETAFKVMSLTNCSEAHQSYEYEMVALDSKTSDKLPIPADRFHCGWQLGNIGKVFNRLWMLSSEKNAEALNHCCAIHLSCYLEQGGRETCDNDFVTCNNRILKTTRTHRNSLENYMNRNHDVMNAISGSYEWMKSIEIVTNKILEFDGNFNKGIKDLSIGVPFFYVNVYSLRSLPTFDTSISESYSDVLNSGWSKRTIIDSCALTAEICRRQDSMNVCLRKLNVCLQGIQGKPEELENAVKKFDNTVTQVMKDNERQLTMEQVKEACTDNPLVTIGFIVVEFFAFLVASWIVHRFLSPKITVPTPIEAPVPSNNEEDNYLTAQPTRGRNNGSVRMSLINENGNT